MGNKLKEGVKGMPNVIDFITKYFPDAEELSNGTFACSCPCHYDEVPSLHISQGYKSDNNGGKVIVMNCKAGCLTEDILAEIGATMTELTGEDPIREKLADHFRGSLGAGSYVADIYDYTDLNGAYLYSKVRIEGTDNGKKAIRYARIDREAGSFISGKGGVDGGIFNAVAVKEAIQQGRRVYICEGEKDVRTLQHLGFIACTYGGANDWRKEYSALFKGADVVILPDNDEPGRQVSAQILRNLKEAAYKIKVVVVSRLEKGDITDYIEKESGTRESFIELVDESEQLYGRFVSVTRDKSGNVTNEKINTDTLADVISRNENYFFVRNAYDDRDSLYVYRSGVYEHTNKNGLIATIIRPYIPTGKATAAVFDNVYKIILSKGTHTATPDDLDNDERYINLKNGLLEVKTGILYPHSPKILSSIQLNVEYMPGAKAAPNFKRYINDLSRNENGDIDKEKIKVWQQYGGLVLSNVKGYRIKKSLFLVSAQGNSGKSVFIRLLQFILGREHAEAISLQMMGGGAYNRFNLGTINGKRLLACGDQSAASIKDSSIFKQLSSGDETHVEAKGKQGYSYLFKGLIVIACNSMPYFEDDYGKHLLDRMLITPCRHVVPEGERDPRMDEKLQEETSAIFNFFFAGLQELIKNDYTFTACADSAAANEEYRTDNDSLYRFIKERYEITGDPNDRIAKTQFEDAYDTWACIQISNGDLYNQVRRKNIKSRLAGYGIQCRRGHIPEQGIHGNELYYGIKALSTK